jgi:hypothetical protein
VLIVALLDPLMEGRLMTPARVTRGDRPDRETRHRPARERGGRDRLGTGVDVGTRLGVLADRRGRRALARDLAKDPPE